MELRFWSKAKHSPNLPYSQESKLTSSSSPNLTVLVEWKAPLERFMGAANCFQWFHPWLFTCDVQTADPNWFGCYISDFTLSRTFHSTRTQSLGEPPQTRIEVGFGANEAKSSNVNKAVHIKQWRAAAMTGAFYTIHPTYSILHWIELHLLWQSYTKTPRTGDKKYLNRCG